MGSAQGFKMRQSVANIGYPKQDGIYRIRFSPYFDHTFKAVIYLGTIQVEGDKLGTSLELRLNKHDEWIKIK